MLSPSIGIEGYNFRETLLIRWPGTPSAGISAVLYTLRRQRWASNATRRCISGKGTSETPVLADCNEKTSVQGRELHERGEAERLQVQFALRRPIWARDLAVCRRRDIFGAAGSTKGSEAATFLIGHDGAIKGVGASGCSFSGTANSSLRQKFSGCLGYVCSRALSLSGRDGRRGRAFQQRPVADGADAARSVGRVRRCCCEVRDAAFESNGIDGALSMHLPTFNFDGSVDLILASTQAVGECWFAWVSFKDR